MNTDTDTDVSAWVRLAEQRLEKINKYEEIINDLPWEDINTGNFRPQRACPDVKKIRNALIALGCDYEKLTEGAVRQYVGIVRTSVALHYHFEADSDEAAEAEVDRLLEGESLSSYVADEVDVDLYYGADIEVEVVE